MQPSSVKEILADMKLRILGTDPAISADEQLVVATLRDWFREGHDAPLLASSGRDGTLRRFIRECGAAAAELQYQSFERKLAIGANCALTSRMREAHALVQQLASVPLPYGDTIRTRNKILDLLNTTGAPHVR